MKRFGIVLLTLCVAAGLLACGSKTGGVVEAKSATEVLQKAWELTPENDRFSAMGGDGENMVDGKAGAYNYKKAEDLGMEYSLCFPTACVKDIDDAASLVHGMMANNFTAGAYHVTDKGNTDKVVKEIQKTAENNQWMCGFPEKLVIATVGDNYVVSVFGLTDLTDGFVKNLKEAFGDSVKVSVDEPIME